MPKRKLESKIKPEYYLEVEGADELEHISDEDVTTVTQALIIAERLAGMTGKRVKLRSMVSLGVVEPVMIAIDPATGVAVQE